MTSDRKEIDMRKEIRHMFFCVATAVIVYAAGITGNAAAPTGIKQTTASKDTIMLEWNTVNDSKVEEVNYGYEVATDPAFHNVIQSGLSAITSGIFNYTVIEKLQAGTTYYVRVGYIDIGQKWNDKKVDHHLSSGVDIVTAPTDFTSAKFVGANDTSAIISYEGAKGATGYEITYNDQTSITTDTSYAIALTDGAYNKAHVLAYRESSSGYKAYNMSKDIYNLSKLTTKISKNHFGISTQVKSSNIRYFKAEGYGEGFDFEMIPMSGKGKITATGKMTGVGNVRIDNMKKNTMYQYRVRAYVTNTDNQKIYGNWSDYRYIINATGTKVTTSGKKIKLKWSKLKGVSNIKIQVATKKNGKYKTCKTLSGKKTGYTIKKYGKQSLKKGKRYYVRIIYMAKKVQSDLPNQFDIVVR